jgi:hypothetical protein
LVTVNVLDDVVVVAAAGSAILLYNVMIVAVFMVDRDVRG